MRPSKSTPARNRHTTSNSDYGTASKVEPPYILVVVIFGVIFQLGMFFFGDTALRMPLRMGIYGLNLLLLIATSTRRGHPHPAVKLIPAIIIVLVLSLINPETALIAGTAQLVLYIATLSPLIWVGRLKVSYRTFNQAIFVLWIFYTASAGLGVLQVLYPHRFDGATSNVIDETYIKQHLMVTAEGIEITRPKGLTDEIGGAGMSGLYALILGLGVLLTTQKLTLKFLSAMSLCAGLAAVLLSNVRVALVVVAITGVAITIVLARRGEGRRLAMLLTVVVGVSIIGSSIAFAAGGEQTIERWETLIGDDPGTVIHQNRGVFLDELISHDMWKFPLGAGGGRWGMMSRYFANDQNSIWAEMTWQGLLYDGGIPLIILYLTLFGVLMTVMYGVALRASSVQLGGWAMVLLGYTFGVIAFSFDGPVLTNQGTIDLFLLTAAIYSCAKGNQDPVFEQSASRRITAIPKHG